MSRRILLVLTTIAGVSLAAAGCWSASTPSPASFGWTAYSPLSNEAYAPYSGPPWWALALIVLGSITVGAAGTLLLQPSSPFRGSGSSTPGSPER